MTAKPGSSNSCESQDQAGRFATSRTDEATESRTIRPRAQLPTTEDHRHRPSITPASTVWRRVVEVIVRWMRPAPRGRSPRPRRRGRRTAIVEASVRPANTVTACQQVARAEGADDDHMSARRCSHHHALRRTPSVKPIAAALTPARERHAHVGGLRAPNPSDVPGTAVDVVERGQGVAATQGVAQFEPSVASCGRRRVAARRGFPGTGQCEQADDTAPSTRAPLRAGPAPQRAPRSRSTADHAPAHSPTRSPRQAAHARQQSAPDAGAGHGSTPPVPIRTGEAQRGRSRSTSDQRQPHQHGQQRQQPRSASDASIEPQHELGRRADRSGSTTASRTTLREAAARSRRPLRQASTATMGTAARLSCSAVRPAANQAGVVIEQTDDEDRFDDDHQQSTIIAARSSINTSCFGPMIRPMKT